MITNAWRAGDADMRPGWRVTFGGADFSVERINEMKREIHYSQRSYNGESKEWWFSQECEEWLVEHFPEFFQYLLQLPLL